MAAVSTVFCQLLFLAIVPSLPFESRHQVVLEQTVVQPQHKLHSVTLQSYKYHPLPDIKQVRTKVNPAQGCATQMMQGSNVLSCFFSSLLHLKFPKHQFFHKGIFMLASPLLLVCSHTGTGCSTTCTQLFLPLFLWMDERFTPHVAHRRRNSDPNEHSSGYGK